jgi:hypothetical protein
VLTIKIGFKTSVVAWLGVFATTGAMGSGPQDNGNKLALEYSTASAARQQEIGKEVAGKVYFFRYLRITGIEKGEHDGQRYVKMRTVEPSSDMRVVFTVEKAASLEVVEPLKENDAVAVSGRIKSIGVETNGIVLAPVVVRYKDRLQPKTGKELLPEVDPSARIGTDTSSGSEVIKLKKE